MSYRILVLIAAFPFFLSARCVSWRAETDASVIRDSAPHSTLDEDESTLGSNPSATLSEGGPWVLVAGQRGLWAANPDGSGLTYIYDVRSDQLVINGRHAVFIEETPGFYGSGLTLKLLSLPNSEVRTITELLSESTELMKGETLSPDDRITIHTALQSDNLVWSPDGTLLAFTSAHEGLSADLYVYSVLDGSLSRLSDHPSQEYRLVWSPNGDHIIFMGADSFGTGAGFAMAGVWIACVDGSCIRDLYTPQSGDELILGWTNETDVLLYSFSAAYGFHNLRALNIETGEIIPYWLSSFEEAALDPQSKTVLLVVNEFIANADPQLEEGLYLVRVNEDAQQLSLWDFFSERLVADVTWHESASSFLVKLSNEFLSISPAGQIELIVPRIINNPVPLASPTENLWAWLDAGTIVINGPQTQIQELFPSDSHPVWGPDGHTVLFVNGGKLHVGSIDDLSDTATGTGLSGGLRWIGP